jgi:hypothetical protein
MGESLREYEMIRRFLDLYQAEIAGGQPVKVEIRDPETYESLKVKGILSPTSLPDSARLWIKDLKEDRWPEPWYIKITEVLDDDEPITSMPPII